MDEEKPQPNKEEANFTIGKDAGKLWEDFNASLPDSSFRTFGKSIEETYDLQQRHISTLTKTNKMMDEEIKMLTEKLKMAEASKKHDKEEYKVFKDTASPVPPQQPWRPEISKIASALNIIICADLDPHEIAEIIHEVSAAMRKGVEEKLQRHTERHEENQALAQAYANLLKTL